MTAVIEYQLRSGVRGVLIDPAGKESAKQVLMRLYAADLELMRICSGSSARMVEDMARGTGGQ